jgi:hypothetical protein
MSFFLLIAIMNGLAAMLRLPLPSVPIKEF